MTQLVPETVWRDLQLESGRNSVIAPLQLRRSKIVCLGGGTGLPVVLRGLARRSEPRAGDPGLELTAVVAMADDGGSSGRLRRSRGLLPPGDIRNCLLALSNEKSALTDLFRYRFGGDKGLGGHAMGNLLIAALAELKGDFMEAVRLSGEQLHARGRVLPSTLAPVQLVAKFADGRTVVGERYLGRTRGRRVTEVSLSPRSPPPAEGLLESIHGADLIVLGPGSLYSSLLPNLLVDGVAKALRESKGLKVLVSNLMTQPGETDGMSCAEHVRAVLDHVGPVVDVVLHNGAEPPEDQVERYARKGSEPVRGCRSELISMGVIPFEADLLKEGPKIRHDGNKVARCLLRLARNGP
jgi:uncharacterized cofD-like protein